MANLRDEMHKKLKIYTKEYQQEYTKCLMRGIEIPIQGRPEEVVRQIFLYFMIKESNLFPDIINIKVEVNNHDIEICKKSKNDNFKPYQSPLMIVELKREDINLKNYYDQIQRYMKKASCPLGILYNFHEIIAFFRKGEQFAVKDINNLKDIESLILQNNHHIDHDVLTFEKAEKGNFESFKYLVGKYGKYTTNRIVFQLKQSKAKIAGYFFNIQGNTVYYQLSGGKYAQKPQSLDYQDFERLISITY